MKTIDAFRYAAKRAKAHEDKRAADARWLKINEKRKVTAAEIKDRFGADTVVVTAIRHDAYILKRSFEDLFEKFAEKAANETIDERGWPTFADQKLWYHRLLIGYTIDKTFEEVEDAISDGRPVKMLVYKRAYGIVARNASTIVFAPETFIALPAEDKAKTDVELFCIRADDSFTTVNNIKRTWLEDVDITKWQTEENTDWLLDMFSSTEELDPDDPEAKYAWLLKPMETGVHYYGDTAPEGDFGDAEMFNDLDGPIENLPARWPPEDDE